MTVGLVHLSDIHIKDKSDQILSKASAIAAVLTEKIRSLDGLVIVVSGDIAFSGERQQYEAAEKFLRELKSLLETESKAPVYVVTCPGNHDCDFSKNSETRKNNVVAITNGGKVDDSVIQSCTSIQKEYFRFSRSIEEEPLHDDLLWRTVVLRFGEKNVQFELLNASWVSQLREDKSLHFPIDRYETKISSAIDTRITVLHHPFNWFNLSVYRGFRRFLRSVSSVVITGHEHEGNVGSIDEQEAGESLYVEGCELQDSKIGLVESGFYLLQLDLDERKFSAIRYLYKKGRYAEDSEDSWVSLNALPDKNGTKARLRSGFLRDLNDPGAAISSGGSALTLSDIFVFPDMKRIQSEDSVRQFLDSKLLLDLENTQGGVLVEADDRAGKTSLLYQVYLSYYNRGFTPILISGASIKRESDSEIDGVINRAIRAQYEDASIDLVRQSPRAKQVLLVDDFDGGAIIDASARAKVLSNLLRRFDYLVLTVDKSFEVKELLESEAGKAIAALSHYEIQPLGFAKRSQLVQRWFTSLKDGTQTEAEFIGRCDQAERLVNSAINKSFIPSSPLFLLTLLHSVETGRAAELKESALGHYYHYLITQGFTSAGIAPDQFTKYFQYVTHLAWVFHSLDSTELGHSDLKNFNEEFSEQWTRVDFELMLRKLIDSQVLCSAGGAYSFRYPYIYFYLKGKYMSDNLADRGIQAYIKNCCDHLYVRENANTVLFLAHHTSDEMLLNTISSSLSSVFGEMIPVSFEGDVGDIVELISEAPELIYKGGNPAQNRERINRIRDDGPDDDGLLPSPEASGELSLSAKLAMLFKTVEILGQLLKNQYATIKRQKKQELIRELFNGPLRALSDFYRVFDKVPDSLISAVGAALARRRGVMSEDEKAVVARRVVSEAVQGVTAVLLFHPARSVNSDDLAEDVEKVVAREGSLAFRLIELATKLDSSKDVPRIELGRLWKAYKEDLVVSRIIKIFVLNRLYMFRTTESDMRWIESQKFFPMALQHAIVYHQSGRKLK